MKKTVPVIAVLALLAASCSNNQPKTEGGAVTVQLKNMPAQEVRLMVWDGTNTQPMALDTVDYQGDDKPIKLFTGLLPEQSYLELAFAKNKMGSIPLVIYNEQINISGNYGDIKNIKITGSSATTELLDFLNALNDKNTVIRGMQTKLDSLANAKQPDSVLLAKEKILLERVNEMLETKKSFITKTVNPVNAVFGLQTLMTRDERRALKPQVDSFTQRFPGSAFIKKAQQTFYNIISDAPVASPGNEMSAGPGAKEISMPDVNGQTVTLSSMKGKWVLIDFWASWCGPCRQENPTVVAAYNKFKNKNFTILGVSLDKDKANWLQAIKDDGLTWTHVSELKFWDSKAARDYGVQGIPQNFLVDPAGNIVASNLRGPALEEELAKRLK